MIRNLALFIGLTCVTANAQYIIMPDSTNNRLVSFSAHDGSLLNSNFFALGGGVPYSAIGVGNEIWVGEQTGDRVSRWSLQGGFLGAIGGGPTGGIDNVRGIRVIGSELYITNFGSGNGSPGPSVQVFSLGGAYQTHLPSTFIANPFDILSHQGDILVSNANGSSDIHRYTMAGSSVGTFHDSTLSFFQQLNHDSSGNVLAAATGSNVVARLNPATGALINSFTATGVRGVIQLGNGNILWSSSTGARVWDASSNTSSLVYSGDGRFLHTIPVPEPATWLAMAFGGALLVLRRRR